MISLNQRQNFVLVSIRRPGVRSPLMAGRAHTRIVRQWRLLQALHGRRRGLTLRELVDEVEASRATLYRDLGVLRDAGVPITTEVVNGEARYALLGESRPALAPSVMELAALRLAVSSLNALRGTSLIDALEAMAGRRDVDTAHIDARMGGSGVDRTIVEKLDAVLRHGRRARILYRGRGDETHRWRTVDASQLRMRERHIYLRAFAIDDGAWRTFKVARVSDVTELPEAVQQHEVDDEVDQHAVRVWASEPIDVAVRLDTDVAWLAAEWPLVASQTSEPTDDGAVIVRARVAGLVETQRWVLSWGRAARAIEPPELVDAVRDELADALERYPKPRAKAAEEGVSHDPRRTDRTIGPESRT